jgi:hypothetical protein
VALRSTAERRCALSTLATTTSGGVRGPPLAAALQPVGRKARKP